MKDIILTRVKKNRPESVDLPEIPVFETKNTSVDTFIGCLEEIGVKTVLLDDIKDLPQVLINQFSDASRVVNTIPELKIDSFDWQTIADPKLLHPLDLAVIRGDFGVVENGAIWINPSSLIMRAIPFLAEHLVILLSVKGIIANMHEAYSRLENDVSDYGVFIAGPSKTADIEQCLVIGAQGPKTLLVALVP